jgi:hypothetical protein
MSAERKDLGPGVWMVGSELHFDPEPILKHLGLPDTLANRAALLEGIKQAARKELPQTIIVDLFDREPPPPEAA